MEPKITNAKQILDIIAPIPADRFQPNYYGHMRGFNCKNSGETDNGCSCFLGHIHRHFEPTDGYAAGDGEGYGARYLTAKFLKEKHGISASGATVNNSPTINGYTEPEIKDRLMHMLTDMVEAGY